jgi:hypothetical protein
MVALLQLQQAAAAKALRRILLLHISLSLGRQLNAVALTIGDIAYAALKGSAAAGAYLLFVMHGAVVASVK